MIIRVSLQQSRRANRQIQPIRPLVSHSSQSQTQTQNKPHHLRYHYDNAGQLIRATSLDATTHLDFDPVGNLVKETLIRHHANQGQEPNKEVNSQTLTHTYDELDNRISTTLPDGTTLNNLYYGCTGTIFLDTP